jgi:hypothetical protein
MSLCSINAVTVTATRFFVHRDISPPSPVPLLAPALPPLLANRTISPSLLYPKHIPRNSSRSIPPSPSRSNSSIIATSSSSPRPSPSSLATRLRSASSILPLPPASKSSNALRISSRGSRARIFCASSDWKDDRERRRREGCVDAAPAMALAPAAPLEEDDGAPCVLRMLTSSAFGMSKPSARSATFSSW